MKKLEDIEKKDIFKVPEGYFDTLPTIIQSRVVKKDESWIPTFVNGFKYALPVLALVVTLLWFYKADSPVSPEDMLASVNATDLAEYIHSMEINNDDFLELLDYSQIEADSLNFQESFVIADDDIDLTDILIEYEGL
jgi:hypothetical protein